MYCPAYIGVCARILKVYSVPLLNPVTALEVLSVVTVFVAQLA